MSRFTTVYCGSRASHLINHTCGCSVTFWTHAARCTPTRSPSFQHVRKKRGRLWCRATGSVVKPWCQHLTSGGEERPAWPLCDLWARLPDETQLQPESALPWEWGVIALHPALCRGCLGEKKFHPAWRALFLSPCMWILLRLSEPNNLIMTLLLHVCLWETQSCKAPSTFHTTYLNTQSDLYIHEVMKDKWLLKLDCCDAAAKINSLMVVLRRFHPSTFFSL